MKRLIVDIEDSEFLALELAAVDPREWFKNFVNVRASQELKNLQMIVAQQCIEGGVQMPATTDEVIALGVAKGWIKTAAQRQAEIVSIQEVSEPA